MDAQMPVMDGVESTKQIRGELGLCKSALPIIGLTASFQHSDLDYYRDIVGMNSCLGKPLQIDALNRAISTAVQHHVEIQKPPAVLLRPTRRSSSSLVDNDQ